ncbi:PDZ domain-containing protein [Betaproteobacteria bacterium]|nr:PDZ domain-containing protein [Betaproteobacteria bacterium]GHU42486.1 PDZ domain-containing protein [Betaproteobacteria bacterium]
MNYTLTLHSPETHQFEITCRVDAPDPDGQRFSLPVWIPGSYMVREFARHIVDIRAATVSGKAVSLTKTDKATWQAAPCAEPLILTYRVYAWDLSVRAAHFDRQHAFFNASSVFLYAHGQENQPCRIDLQPPEHAADWQVATSLPGDGAAPFGFGAYLAADYAELLDHPVEMGRFVHLEFDVQGVPHHLMVTGCADFDHARVRRDLARICRVQMDLFGKPKLDAPYYFLLTAVDSGYGGLEHKNASALLCKRADLPAVGAREQGEPDSGYVRFLGLASHEYFHRWNVKRIRPKALLAPDWQAENYTRLLWFFEGVTSYYDDLCLLRADLIDEASYLDLLAKTISQVQQTPGRHVQSLAESSFDAWIKYYRPDENTPNAVISYYTKGALTALCLDLALRRKGRNLDDFMRGLWRDADKGVEETEIFARVAKLGGSALGRWLQNAVEGTDELPLARQLAHFGVKLIWQPENPRPWLGARLKHEGNKTRISHITAAGPAEQAGLAAGDVLVALQGNEVTPQTLDALLARLVVGQDVECHYFRHGTLASTKLTPVAPPADTARLKAVSGAKAKERRQSWLGTPTAPKAGLVPREKS